MKEAGKDQDAVEKPATANPLLESAGQKERTDLIKEFEDLDVNLENFDLGFIMDASNANSRNGFAPGATGADPTFGQNVNQGIT